MGHTSVISPGAYAAGRRLIKRAVPCSRDLATAVRFGSRLLENLGGSPAAIAQFAAATLAYGATTNQAKLRSPLAREPSTATYGVISVFRCVDAQRVAA